MSDRLELLGRYGAAYGELHLAIGFTDGISGEAAKKNSGGWKGAKPLPNAAEGIALLTSRGLWRNPILVLGASGLIAIEVDGQEGSVLARALEGKAAFPTTVTVRSKRGLHWWYRPVADAPDWVVKVQLASKVTVSRDGYLVCPPACHPDGITYAFVKGREPWAIPIATLPLATAQLLAKEGRASAARVRALSGPIEPGDRHEHLRQISWAMRRYSGASFEAIEAALLVENESRCTPPKAERLVRALAEYTYLNVNPISAEDD